MGKLWENFSLVWLAQVNKTLLISKEFRLIFHGYILKFPAYGILFPTLAKMNPIRGFLC